ncbi:FimV/HubP family polar landmark protein [Saccharospirillum mangrovi]|uniref:FimV/HubP family polar landmark protein n=1 Tax=Saccharospirillum mangrovi TaxID=2161747 RepID=UPI0013B46726|nr:FimV/HubP family polar landmark protein [Saccharospirillum mangrovi]
MFKKQALAFLAALALIGSAQALGLGDIELNSNLNEPLDARIQLLEPSDLSANEILPTLASRLAFEQAGVERDFFLSNIRFDVQPAADGGLVIQLSTSQAVREPFLNFLVEVNWPGGRLLKEYTLLLDPPVFDTAAADQTRSVEPASSAAATTSSAPATTQSPAQAQAQAQAPAPRRYQVQRADTLWEIALSVDAGTGYLPQQVMLAIQDLNPDAFLDNNINRIKTGAVLTLPTQAQIAARSSRQAISEVGQQNVRIGLTTNGRQPADVQLSATESTSSALPQGEAERNPDGYLEVSNDADTEGSSAGGDVSDNREIERLQNELAIAGELNDQFERESQAMEARLAELEEQLAIMQRMLNLQGGDTAALQAELAELDDAAAEDESSLFDWEVIKQQYAILWQEFIDLMAPVMDWVMATPLNTAIAVAAALFVVALPSFIAGLVRRSQRHDDVDLDSMEVDEGDDLLDSDGLDSAVDEAIREAEMYMAYHNYERAEEVLQPWLYDAPARSDLGLKLLEVYAASDDLDAFDDLSERLPLTAEERAMAEAMRDRMTEGDFDEESDSDSDVLGGFDIDSDDGLDDLELETDSDEDALPVDDLDAADLEEVPTKTAVEADSEDDLAGEGDEGFDLSLDDLDVSDELEDDDEETSGGLDFDLSDLGLEAEEDDELMPAAAETTAPDVEADTDDDAGTETTDELDELDDGEPPVLDTDAADYDLDAVDISGPADSSLPDWNDDDEVAIPAGAELEEDEYDFLSGADEASTKLDLARAYMEMEDAEGARDILEEVLTEGNDDQKRQAQELMDRL